MGGIVNAIAGAAKSAAPEATERLAQLGGEFVDRVWSSGMSTLKNLKPSVQLEDGSSIKVGEFMHNMIQDQRTSEGTLSGQLVSNVKNAMQDVPIADRMAVAKNPSQATPEAQTAWQQVQAHSASLTQELQNRGIKIRTPLGPVPITPVQDFMPIVLKDSVLKPGAGRDNFVSYLASQINGNTEEAKKMVLQARGAMFGLHSPEWMYDFNGINIPDEFKHTDPLVAHAVYSDAVAKYISKVDTFGPKNEVLKSLIDAMMGPNTTDPSLSAQNFARDLADTFLHGNLHYGKNYYDGQTQVENTIKQFEGLTKLGRAMIPHSTQLLNTGVLTDITSVAKGLTDTITNWGDAKDFAIKSGSLVSEAIRDFKSNVKGEPTWMDSLLHYTGFDAVRKFNITVTANAAKHYVDEMADKLASDPANKEAQTMLKTLGIEPSQAMRGISEQDYLTAARRANEMTQFIGQNPVDMPIAMQKNPFMRTMFLYKSYVYNEGKFVKDVLFKKSLESGKYQNLAYAALLFPVVGELVGDAEGLARGQTPEHRDDNDPLTKVAGLEDAPLARRVIDNYAKLGHLGVFFSVIGSMNRNNILGWIAGPAGGDLQDLGMGTWRVVKDHNIKPLAKSVASRVPVVGPALKNYIDGQ
jgi:hypothetical protein